MTDPIHVPSFGPIDAEYAVVGQSPGRVEGERGRPFVGPAGSLGKEWLTAAGLDVAKVYFCNVYEYVLLRQEKPSSTDVKHGIDRVKRELAELPNLKAVVLFGSYAARCAFSLKGGITRAQGRQGLMTLADSREVQCIVSVHPSFVNRQKTLRQRQQWDNDCRSVIARITFLNDPLVLPDVVFSEGCHIGPGLIGLDTETAYQAGKKVNPRDDPLLITGLSDGRVFLEPPTFHKNAEPVVHNTPFDEVVEQRAASLVGRSLTLVKEQPRWHDSKMLAHLVGEADTSMKGLATRLLHRPMMEYDPQLRVRASEKLRRGVRPEDDEDVRIFCAYCAQDGMAHRDILVALLQQADDGTKWVYENIERPMLPIYSKWTATGVFRLDKKAALTKRDVLDGQTRKMRRDLEAISGVDSPNKHAKLATAIGIPSTDAKYVEKVWPKLNKRQRDILTLVGRVRSLERQRTTYLDAWLAWEDPLISTIWRPTAAWTGRPGSAEPNLQNIPGPCGDCTMCLRREISSCPFNLKPLLLAPEGMTLYELDNSQAELRVAAHLSQDPAMILAFTEGIEIDGEIQYDLHAWAQKRIGLSSRKEAKIRVLATFYGQTSEGARASTEIQEVIRSIFQGYVRWSTKVKRLIIVPGLFGRRLFVPPTANRGHQEREAINCGSQGGAADILKLQLKALERAGFDTRHAIHDSALIACPDADAGEDFLRTAIETMENAVELSVPMKVEGGFWPHE